MSKSTKGTSYLLFIDNNNLSYHVENLRLTMFVYQENRSVRITRKITQYLRGTNNPENEPWERAIFYSSISLMFAYHVENPNCTTYC